MDPGDPYFGVSQPAWAGHFGGLVSGIFSPHAVQYANRPYFGPYSRPFRPNSGQGPSRNLGRSQGDLNDGGGQLNVVGRFSQPTPPYGYVSQQFPGSTVANCVDVEGTLATAPPKVPWRTKPRAWVFDVDDSQCIGLPRIPNFRALNFSDASHYDSSYSSGDPYIPISIGSSYDSQQNG
ncbi:hypothetical protein PVK06_039680 [Gossypium arboreum]|uniref:Uncharacterized protein n=1 Tax=Gossypium arboreum TaxID=29729 RepID=A0ABR0N491_GOSAR|nr:hypothetical protein PVK06_039680 [Gossypium arboreum]